MSGLTYTNLYPNLETMRDNIRALLDEPAEEFVKDKTINLVHKRAFNTVDSQLNIVDDIRDRTIDLIDAIASWHVFGSYVNTMGDNLSNNNSNYQLHVKLKHFKEVAMGLGKLLGVDVTGEIISINNNTVIAGDVGMSNYRDIDYYDEAADSP